MTVSKDIFDKAITLRAGQQMLVPCHDSRQQESLRVSIAWQRRSFQDKALAGFDILCSKVTKNGKPYLVLKKVPRISQVLIVDEDGGANPSPLTPSDAMSEIADIGLDHSRIRRAMEEDGKSPEEIAAYFSAEETSKIDTNLDTDECNLSPEVFNE